MSSRRHASTKAMKRPLYLVPLAAFALVACADHLDPLDYEDEAAVMAIEPGYAVVPDAPPGFEPMIDFDGDSEPPSLSISLEDDESCGYSVEAKGLPAVSHDGARVAHVLNDPPGNADSWAMGSAFVVIEFDGDDQSRSSERRLLEGWNQRFDDPAGSDDGQCRAYTARLRERIEAYNDELTGYRPMAPLDVVADGRPRIAVQSALDLVDPASLPAMERPVVARWRSGWFTLRVPGVTVIAKQEQEQWMRPDEFCDDAPHLQAVYADRRSGRGLVLLDYISGGCLCEDGEYFEPIGLDDSVFDAIESHPSAGYTAALDAAEVESWEASL